MEAVVEPSSPPDWAGAWTVPIPGSHDRESKGRAMEACRRYLLLVAERELDADLRAKGGASDLVQQTFLEAIADFPRFTGRGEGEMRAWLRCILQNNLANFRRKFRATGKRGISLEVSIDDPDAVGGARAQLVSGEPSPSHHARCREMTQALAQGLEQLPENYRRVILWRYQEKQSFEEIVRRLGSSADAARMVWARAIKRLQREILEVTGGAGSWGPGGMTPREEGGPGNGRSPRCSCPTTRG